MYPIHPIIWCKIWLCHIVWYRVRYGRDARKEGRQAGKGRERHASPASLASPALPESLASLVSPALSICIRSHIPQFGVVGRQAE